MKEYEVEIQEVYTSKVRVKANSRAEAFVKVCRGEGEDVDNSLEYNHILETNPMYNLEQEFPGLLAELKEFNEEVSLNDDTHIRAIEEV